MRMFLPAVIHMYSLLWSLLTSCYTANTQQPSGMVVLLILGFCVHGDLLVRLSILALNTNSHSAIANLRARKWGCLDNVVWSTCTQTTLRPALSHWAPGSSEMHML